MPSPRNVDVSSLTYSISKGAIEAIIWVFCGLAGLFTIFRIVTLYLIRRRQHSPEHYLAIVAMVLLLLTTILLEIATVYGRNFVNSARNFYLHGTPIDFSHQNVFTNVTVAFFVVSTTCLWTCKFSILFFTRILISPVKKHHLLFGTIFALLLSTYIVAMVILFKPTFLPGAYGGYTQEPGPISLVKVALKVHVALDICSDVFRMISSHLLLFLDFCFFAGCSFADLNGTKSSTAMIIPLVILPKLKIGLRQKVSAVIMFVLGFIIIAFSITRVAESLQDLPSANAGTKYFLYTQIEASVAVIVCNLPVIRVLQKYLARRLRPGKYSGNTSSASRTNANNNPEAVISVMTSTRLSYTTLREPPYQPLYDHQPHKSEEVLLDELPKVEEDITSERNVSRSTRNISPPLREVT